MGMLIDIAVLLIIGCSAIALLLELADRWRFK